MAHDHLIVYKLFYTVVRYRHKVKTIRCSYRICLTDMITYATSDTFGLSKQDALFIGSRNKCMCRTELDTVPAVRTGIEAYGLFKEKGAFLLEVRCRKVTHLLFDRVLQQDVFKRDICVYALHVLQCDRDLI